MEIIRPEQCREESRKTREGAHQGDGGRVRARSDAIRARKWAGWIRKTHISVRTVPRVAIKALFFDHTLVRLAPLLDGFLEFIWQVFA